MKCPYCRCGETKVLETRESEGFNRRRRECLKCTKRFTTFEKVETINLLIVKKDNRREPFNREKLLDGVLRACQKRPVAYEVLENIADEIETKLLNRKSHEVKSTDVGEMVMCRLRKVDAVAYIRFASVYRDFDNLNTFQEELEGLIKEIRKKKNNEATQKGRETQQVTGEMV